MGTFATKDHIHLLIGDVATMKAILILNVHITIAVVGMGCQDETVEMESQGEKERGETLVCRDHMAHKVAACYTEKLFVELLLARKIPRSPLNSHPCI